MVSAGTIEHKMLGVLSFKKGLSEGILDQGENSIFMEDSKFKILMNSVEEMIGQETSLTDLSDAAENVETDTSLVENDTSIPDEEADKQPETSIIQSFIGDDDVKQPGDRQGIGPVETTTPADLIQTGLSFLGKLAQTLSSPEATQQLVSSIVQKDEKDGKIYLKIPVENEKVIENMLTIFAGIFNQKKN